MISCTEFIPLYSEFFKFLEKKGGHDAVMEYWIYISDNSIGDKTNPNSLAYKCEQFGGFEGARAYWGHTLTEEACDLCEIYNPEERYIYEHMRHCPSRGMLNSLEHIEPYYDYCEHCKVIYSRVLEKYGVVYERDHSKIANAECSSILYEKGNKPQGDYTKPTESCIVTDMKSEDNKYLHRDFHLLGDLALTYCGEKFGDNGVTEFLTDYTKAYFAPLIEEIKKTGLSALEKHLKRIYDVEEAAEVLHTKLSDSKLEVTVDKSPVIEYMHSLGQKPGKYYIEETRTLYSVIASECDLKFYFEYYKDNGNTRFVFEKQKEDSFK